MDDQIINLLIITVAATFIILSGVPIAYGLAMLCILTTIFIVGPERFSLLGNVAYGEVAQYTLIAIPLFILTAELLAEAKISDRAFEVFARRLRKLPGSLGVACTALSTIFAAIVGSSAGNTAIMGLVALKPMLQRGYDPKLATGTIIAGGALGVLIPPSTMMILYGVVTEVSVGQLLVAGLIPGLLMSLAMFVYIIILALVRPQLVGRDTGTLGPADGDPPEGTPHEAAARQYVPSRNEAGQLAVATSGRVASAFSDFRAVGPVLLLLLFMIWAMYAGFATPSEVAALGSVAAIFLLLVYRRFTVRGFVGALINTARVTAMILLLVVMGAYLGRLLAFMGVARTLVEAVTSLGWPPYAVVFAICGVLFLLGTVFDSAAIILIVAPLAAPVVVGVGFDPVWWGVIFVINMEIALISPPFGINLFVMKSIAMNISLGTIMRGAWPFVAIQSVVLFICIMFPEIILWMPHKMA